MAKIGIFKKIAALATAIAIVLCFALTAGAVNVTTLTSYVDGNAGDILVEVTIAGDDIVDKSVSYYAYNSEGDPVYIDQIEGGRASVSLEYVTGDANLNSDVKVGYTGASEAKDANIDGIKVTWGTVDKYVPTDAEEATVVFETDATTINSVTATGAEVKSYVPTPGQSVSIVLEEFTGDDVVLTIDYVAAATAQIIDAAYVVSNGHDDISKVEAPEAATAWGQHLKLTAIGRATGTISSGYGVIVYESGKTYTDADYYQAVQKTTSGYYAVQLVDDISDESTFLLKSKNYDVKAYADSTVSDNTKTAVLNDLTKKQ